MKLYIIPGACSLAVNIALREAAIPFELARLDRHTGKADGVDFRSINPKGYVPALRLDDGRVLTETIAILQYVADQNPQARLAPPAATFERYRLVEWLAFISTEVHKAFSPLYSDEASQPVKDYALSRLAKRLDYLDGVVHAAHLLGDEFTVADAYLFTVFGWVADVGIDPGLWPGLQGYHANIARRPHVAAALESEA